MHTREVRGFQVEACLRCGAVLMDGSDLDVLAHPTTPVPAPPADKANAPSATPSAPPPRLALAPTPARPLPPPTPTPSAAPPAPKLREEPIFPPDSNTDEATRVEPSRAALRSVPPEAPASPPPPAPPKPPANPAPVAAPPAPAPAPAPPPPPAPAPVPVAAAPAPPTAPRPTGPTLAPSLDAFDPGPALGDLAKVVVGETDATEEVTGRKRRPARPAGPRFEYTDPSEVEPRRNGRRVVLVAVAIGIWSLVAVAAIVVAVLWWQVRGPGATTSPAVVASTPIEPAPAPTDPNPVATPDPVAAEPAPVAAEPAPVAAEPAPVAAEPAPAAPRPAPVAPAPAPASPRPVPAPAPAPRGGSRAQLVRQGWDVVESDPGRAASLFSDAMALAPTDAEANYGYGYAMVRQGNAAAAAGPLCLAKSRGDIEIQREVAALLDRSGLTCP